MINSIGEFKKYDHGLEKNKKLYGRETPPDYNLNNVRARIHLIYGVNDNGILAEVRTINNTFNVIIIIWLYSFFQYFRIFHFLLLSLGEMSLLLANLKDSIM